MNLKRILTLCILQITLCCMAGQNTLEVGPIDGLTTIWHTAPKRLTVPKGVTLTFRAEKFGGASWTGAREVNTPDSLMTSASRKYDQAGVYRITIHFLDSDGVQRSESRMIEVLDTLPEQIILSPVRIEAINPFPVHDLDDNGTVWFWGESIASVEKLASHHFCTSVNRELELMVDVQPAAFAPMVEWRFSQGRVELGAAIKRSFGKGEFQIEVGPTEHAKTATLDVYAVKITSHRTNSDVLPDGEPVVLSAQTDPPGFEDHITWMASTSYGSCDPVTGRGANFTVTFSDTIGLNSNDEVFQWLGVKADNFLFNQDDKPELFAGFIHEPTGGAVFRQTDEGMSVSLPESEGGFSVDLGRSAGWGAYYDIDDAEAVSITSSIRGHVDGLDNQLVALAEISSNGSRNELRVDYSALGPNPARVTFYSANSEALASFERTNGEPIVLEGSGSKCIEWICDEIGGRTVRERVRICSKDDDLWTAEAPGVVVDNVSFIEVTAGDPPNNVEYVSSGELTVEGVSEFTLTRELVQAAPNDLFTEGVGPVILSPGEGIGLRSLDFQQPSGFRVDLNGTDLWEVSLSDMDLNENGMLTFALEDVSSEVGSFELRRDEDELEIEAKFTGQDSPPDLRLYDHDGQTQDVSLDQSLRLSDATEKGGVWWRSLNLGFDQHTFPFDSAENRSGLFLRREDDLPMWVALKDRMFLASKIEILGDPTPFQKTSVSIVATSLDRSFGFNQIPPCLFSQEQIVAGRRDGFNTGDGIEPATPRTDFSNWHQLNGPGGSDFDDHQSGRWFCHIANLPAKMTGMVLSFGLYGLDDAAGDSISLGFISDSGYPNFVWSGSLSQLLGVWKKGEKKTLALNLAALPTNNANNSLNMMAYINRRGYLDVFIQDGTAVDYIAMNATICPDSVGCDAPITSITSGNPDSFDPGIPDLPTQPRPELAAYMANTALGIREYDEAGNDTFFGETLNFTAGCIVGAQLTVGMRAHGNANDTINLGFNGDVANPAFTWSSTIGAVFGTIWSGGANGTMVLDLANLPGNSTSLLSALNDDGFLDIVIEDDTSIDFIRLDLDVCSPCNPDCIQVRTTYRGGIRDNFNPTINQEPVQQSQMAAAWLKLQPNHPNSTCGLTSRDFDQPGPNTFFGHSIPDIPECSELV